MSQLTWKYVRRKYNKLFFLEIQRKICKRGIKYFWKIERIQNLMIGSSKIHRCKQSVNLWKPENEPKTFFQLNPNIREVCQSNKLATLNILWEKKAQIMDAVVDKNLFLCFSSQFSGNNTMAAEKKLGQCVNVHLIKLFQSLCKGCR